MNKNIIEIKQLTKHYDLVEMVEKLRFLHIMVKVIIVSKGLV